MSAIGSDRRQDGLLVSRGDVEREADVQYQPCAAPLELDAAPADLIRSPVNPCPHLPTRRSVSQTIDFTERPQHSEAVERRKLLVPKRHQAAVAHRRAAPRTPSRLRASSGPCGLFSARHSGRHPGLEIPSLALGAAADRVGAHVRVVDARDHVDELFAVEAGHRQHRDEHAGVRSARYLGGVVAAFANELVPGSHPSVRSVPGRHPDHGSRSRSRLAPQPAILSWRRLGTATRTLKRDLTPGCALALAKGVAHMIVAKAVLHRALLCLQAIIVEEERCGREVAPSLVGTSRPVAPGCCDEAVTTSGAFDPVQRS